ncbi:hypothetical protein BFP70_18450 [Thioclava sp. SK-1]|uniref:NAD-dependent epimerase/dehydratase family protein n=1 Tax=Thioclava sp. SK-1 TaxID=1889770 RepID=UPI0008249C3B|nr:NAD-dependent epimerase/dehydratase family protein [Thioclava sp. SK-1]OCX58623.1 hypothetical protein BFP70_18450 [Thioclava sp. SK-1]
MADTTYPNEHAHIAKGLPMEKTLLLTGITGFLGGHIAICALNAGYRVRGSLRDMTRADATRLALAANGADTSRLDFVELDLLRDAGWTAACDGIDYMVHAASPFVTAMPKDPLDLIRPAVEGTDRALRAAHHAGIQRIVLTSSQIAMHFGLDPATRPDSIGPDNWSTTDNGRLNAYGQSKTLAEQHAWALAKALRLPLATLQPGLITGPLWDDDPGTSGQIALRLMRGAFPLAPKLALYLCDVRDIAQIHVNALTAQHAAGQRHPCAFEPLTIMQIAQAITEVLPQYRGKMPKAQLPNPITRALALFDTDLRGIVNELNYVPQIDTARGHALLGRAPIPARQSIADMAISLSDRALV